MDIQRPRGTRDFLFEEMKERREIENTLRRVFETYGYGEIKTPLFEDLALFTKKSGEEITGQIYHFQDKSGRELALRPELTAPVSRLYINELQKSPKPLKMYYFGSCFRYERPQKGRYRQFWQMGCELIGGKSPESEAEIIAMAAHSLEELGVKDFEIHIGNLGIIRGILHQANAPKIVYDTIMAVIDKGEVEELLKTLNEVEIDPKASEILIKLVGMVGQREIIKETSEIIKDNPKSVEALNELDELLDILEAFGFTNYKVNLGIARGLDYYSGIVFEIYAQGLGAQKQISGGGTYNLIEIFGGEKVESTGFAFGFDRLVECVRLCGEEKTHHKTVDVYVAPVSKDVKLKAIEIAQKFRKDGIKTEVDLVGRKLKKILNQANNLQVDYVILVGERDLKEGKVTVKNMESGEQELVEIESVTQMMIDLLK
ncbi:MAG TPA: histidine--tRNA ligase [Methanobacterium sp.]|jgi:histidyl-tRNA synthetase|nr:MAG: histidine--tRNA ligase [Methanobacterium sp.]HOI70697.1 histidine--tRNA ligase [Methanobacterium sp.]